MISIKPAQKHHLPQILELQYQNLRAQISDQEQKEQGFVSVVHDLDLLSTMNDPYPHMVALDQDQVVGYALTMLPSMKDEIDILKPMFEMIKEERWLDQTISEYRFYVMGQICIAKAYRSQGIFKQLYLGHQKQMSDSFDLMITEVSSYNTRSTRAHEKVGFKLIKAYNDHDNQPWQMIGWDWS